MPVEKEKIPAWAGFWSAYAGLEPASPHYAMRYVTSYTIGTLALPMPKGRGFLVRRPLRHLRGIGVLHDLPKREFPCTPRYLCIEYHMFSPKNLQSFK